MKITLDRPLKVGTGAELTELVLRDRICAGDYRGIKTGSLMQNDPREVPIDDWLTIAERLSGQPRLVINDLSEGDLAKVIEAIISFRQSGQKTATAASP